MENDIFVLLISIIIMLFLINPKSLCKCTEKFDQKLVDSNCSQLKNDSFAIAELQKKVCNSNISALNDRERLSLSTSCRDAVEMNIFNSRETGNWCASATKPASVDPKSNPTGKTVAPVVIPAVVPEIYPAVGKIILNGNYYLIDEKMVEPVKDKVLSELKLDTYSDFNYAAKI